MGEWTIAPGLFTGARVISPSYPTTAPAALSSNHVLSDDIYIIANTCVIVNTLHNIIEQFANSSYCSFSASSSSINISGVTALFRYRLKRCLLLTFGHLLGFLFVPRYFVSR